MVFGNKPTDGGHLILDRNERDELLSAQPSAARFIRRIYGSQEVMKGLERWCLWFSDNDFEKAKELPQLEKRFEKVAHARSTDESSDIARSFVDRPYRFLQRPGAADSHTIIIPTVTSENRVWLPVELLSKDCIVSNLAFAIFDGGVWQASWLSSRMHRLWLETIGGKLESRVRYSNGLVWNNFPVPNTSERRKDELEEHWWEIDRARKEAGFGRTLGELYAPKIMPDELRRAHEDLDATIEAIFGSRKYRSDADRIEHMLQLYERAAADAGAGKA